jgi:hypothetical protein
LTPPKSLAGPELDDRYAVSSDSDTEVADDPPLGDRQALDSLPRTLTAIIAPAETAWIGGEKGATWVRCLSGELTTLLGFSDT